MNKIAICDDQRFYATQLKNIVENYFSLNKEDVEISTYSDGITLLTSLKEGKTYDLILLDIKMEELDGIELGRIIREENKWEKTQIIYISSEKHRAIEALPIRVFDFVYKPIETAKLEKILKRFLDIKNYKNEYIELTENKNKQKILFDSIIYIEGQGRNNLIVTQEKTYQTTKTLAELENILPKRNFARMHKGFIINLDKIKLYNYQSVTMTNNKEIPIPKNRRVEIRKIFADRKGKI